MGGTFIRLVDQGHDVHVAYQTSGNTAVWDDDVLRYMEFAIDFNASIGDDNTHLKKLYEDMRVFLANKQPNEIDTMEIRDVKGFIRKTEAISGARYAGLGRRPYPLPGVAFLRNRQNTKEPGEPKRISNSP